MKEKKVESVSKNKKKHIEKSIKKWDKYLDDYENYLKEYIKHYKKSLKGNVLSLSKYPYMKAKSEALYDQLNNAQNKNLLTDNQQKRISKIKKNNQKFAFTE